MLAASPILYLKTPIKGPKVLGNANNIIRLQKNNIIVAFLFQVAQVKTSTTVSEIEIICSK